MAVTVTKVFDGNDLEVFEIEATADADIAGVLTHGLGAAPVIVSVCPLLAAAYTSQWRMTGRTAADVTMTKGNAVGSGAAGVQLRVTLSRPHYLSLNL